MIRLLVLALLAVTVAASSLAQAVQPRYSEVRITLGEGERVADLGLDIDHVRTERRGGQRTVTTVVSERDLATLEASGVRYEIVVEDLAAHIAARVPMSAAEQAAVLAERGGGGFGFGSMAGYYTFEEIVAKLDEMAAAYPEIVTEKVSIGTSWEGNDIWMVKISDNPNLDEDEPEALYDALHHAREPQSMATVLYYMFYLLENYGSDPEVTYLVDNRELYFIPVLNPDGYLYNEQTDPEGGGFWRKNRRDNGGNVFGVDLNRNYGYAWGYDNQGSSPDPGSDTYRGPAEFSEPETQAIRDFLLGREVRAALNYHSYGDLWIYPWGYEPSFYTPDSALYVDSAREMTRENSYFYGTGDQTVGYLVNGVSDDWMYGEQETKDKIFAFTPEVGPSFWPGQDQIFPLAEENVEANLTLAWFVGGYPQVADVTISESGGGNGYVDPGEVAEATVSVYNLGLGEISGLSARIVSADPALLDAASPFLDGFNLASQETVDFTLPLSIAADAPLGITDALRIEFELEGVTLVRPLGPVAIGTPVVVYADDASSDAAWDTGLSWGLTSTNTSPPTALTDSPSGNYSNSTTNALTLLSPLDLSERAGPQLRFRARWDIEGTYDYVQVRASTDGANWTALSGRYTREGSGIGVQPEGEPGYDGEQVAWVDEAMDLGAFGGEESVYLQFRLRSDGLVRGDGFYVDDLTVESFTNGSLVANEDAASAERTRLGVPYPNPFEGEAVVPFVLAEAGHVELNVYDVLGRRVRVLVREDKAAGGHSATWDGRDARGRHVASGLYVIELRAGEAVHTHKVMRVR